MFSRAIAQSGCALCPWAVEDEDPCETSFKLGKAFGLETNDPDELVNFLRKIPSKVLVRKQTAALSEKVTLKLYCCRLLDFFFITVLRCILIDFLILEKERVFTYSIPSMC